MTFPGQVAQSVEQGTENPRVGGSIPSLATIVIKVLATPSILVVFQDENPVTQFVPDKASYIDIESVFDVDNDGLHDVLLTAAAYQMGTLFIVADVYGFNESGSLLKQEMGVVYTNSCEVETLDGREIRASVLSTGNENDKLVVKTYQSLCTKNGEPLGIESFTATPLH